MQKETQEDSIFVPVWGLLNNSWLMVTKEEHEQRQENL